MRVIQNHAWPIALAGVVIVLVAARAYAPIALQSFVNRALDRADGYEGRVGDVDLQLWRGAYEIEDVEILKSGNSAPVPLLSAPLVDLSLEWRALFDGSLVGEIWLEQPQLNFVGGPPQDRQTGVEADWREVVRSLLPVRINRITARDGSVHFRTFRTEPPVDVYLNHVQLVVENLTNSRDLSDDLVARARFSGVPMNAGRLDGRLSIDPTAEQPSFDLDCEVTGVSLKQFNDLFRAYLGIDVQRGDLRLYVELRAERGHFDGYVKPFFENVDVITPEEVDDQGPLRSLWEGVVGSVAEVFEDQEQDRVATRIPISGSVESPDIGFWPTLANVLRNAFLDAFVPALENSVGRE